VSRRVPVVLLLVLFVSVAVGCGGEQPSTLEGIWEEYREAHQNYHDRLYQFAVDRWPDFKPLLKLQKEHQFVRLKLRERRFEFLRDRHPDQLPTDQTIHDLVNFEWHDRHDTAFYSEYPEARRVEKRVNDLRKRVNNHNSWPALRSRFQELPPDSGYREIRTNYQARLDQLDRALQAWQSSPG
jgi:hypothetical protein